MFIGIIGNFDKEKMALKIKKIIKKYKNTKQKKNKFLKINPEKKIVKYTDDVKQSQIVIDWITEKLEFKEYLTLRLINFIIGGNSNSLLFQEIRNNLGLVYNIRSRSLDWPNANGFEITTSVDNQNTNLLIEKIKETLQKFVDIGINQEKLQKTKNFMNIQTLMGSDTIYNICENTIYNLFYYGKIMTPEDFIKAANQITPDEINQMIKKIINWDNSHISIMSPNTTK
jgi:predicted Zn-dependent peptidase